MPDEALATSKRKFYRALDSLSTASLPHNSSPQASEPVSKRPRRSTSSATQAAKATALPNFAPWSHEQFLSRLATFASVSAWHLKPDGVGEVEWAKRGWVCATGGAANTVACKGGCEKRVQVVIEIADDEAESDEVEALEAGLVERYKRLIVDGHADTCLWRQAGCKEDVYRLQVVRPAIWQAALRERYETLVAASEEIKDLTTITHLEPKGTTTLSYTRVLEDLTPEVLPSSELPLEVRESALKISLHGWHATTTTTPLLHCTACFQRIGLWMYQPGYHSTHSSQSDESTATIDLLEMHREHCPWRNAASQCASGGWSGMGAAEVLGRVVATFAREQRRRRAESVHVPDSPLRDEGEGETEDVENASPAPSTREEVVRLDRERDSRLQKLKKLFSVKRKGGTVKVPVPGSKSAAKSTRDT